MTFAEKQSNHRRICTMLGHALTLGNDRAVWDGLTLVLRCRLSALERACLLACVTAAMATEDVEYVVGEITGSAGYPLPVFDQAERDARWWADLASSFEIKAWLLACFARLSKRDQQEFLAAASRRAAA